MSSPDPGNVIGDMSSRTTRTLATRLTPQPGWRRRFLSDQIHPAARAVLAAVAAWEVGLRLGPPPAAYFAAFAALAANYPTVARSIRQTLYYATSVLASVLLVFLVDQVTTLLVAELALAVGAAIIVGGLRVFGRSGGTIAFWSLLLIVVGGHPPSSFLRERLPEAAVGLAIGVAVNVIAFPRLRIGPVQHGVRGLEDDLADVLDATAHDLREDWPPHQPQWTSRDDRLARRAAKLQSAAQDTIDSIRWNPRARRGSRRPLVRAHLARTESLQRITLAVTGIVRTLNVSAGQEGTPAALNPDFRTEYADQLRCLVGPLRAGAEIGGERHPADLTGVSDQLRRMQARLDRARHDDPTVWLSEALLLLQLGAICAELDGERQPAYVQFPAVHS